MGIPAAVYYPGIVSIQSATIRLGHGHTPDGFQLVIAAQPSNNILEIGTLTLEYNNETLAFPDCRVDQASFNFDSSGNLIGLTILDRRWRWQVGRISGEYNVRREDGTIKNNPLQPREWAVFNTERTPQELAILCLRAAGEILAPNSVSEMPDDVRPYVFWDDSNPMAELASLAESLGCRVVYNPASNLTRVVKLNAGRQLPTDRLIRYGASVDYFDGPDEVALITGYIRTQHDFKLEAVGMDVDGNVKPIDELSYRPAEGWGSTDILSRFSTLDLEGAQNLAIRTVFRWYRVRDDVPHTPFLWMSPTTVVFAKREQIILLGDQVFKETIDGAKAARPAMVYGIWFRGEDAGPGNSATTIEYLPDDAVEKRQDDDARVAMIVSANFTIDPETLIVKFSDVIWKRGDGSTEGGNEFIEPAELRLRTSCYVRERETGGIYRKRKNRVIRNTPNPTVMHMTHDEIKPAVYTKYDADFEPIEPRENTLETDLEIEHYLDEAFARYSSLKIPATGLYGGFVFNVPLDGAIQSISWTLGANNQDGPTTTIERCHDSGGAPGVPYRLKREYQRTADTNRRMAQADTQRKEQALLTLAIKEK